MISTLAERRIVGRFEAAERLRTVARQIEEGRVVIRGEARHLPDRLLLEIEVGRRELDVQLTWRPASDEEPGR